MYDSPIVQYVEHKSLTSLIEGINAGKGRRVYRGLDSAQYRLIPSIVRDDVVSKLNTKRGLAPKTQMGNFYGDDVYHSIMFFERFLIRRFYNFYVKANLNPIPIEEGVHRLLIDSNEGASYFSTNLNYSNGDIHYYYLPIMARMQHLGLPTRLLDWTYSPAAALFFATRAKSNCDLGENLAIWDIDTTYINKISVYSKIYTAPLQMVKAYEEDFSKFSNFKAAFYHPLPSKNENLNAQSGLLSYTESAVGKSSAEELNRLGFSQPSNIDRFDFIKVLEDVYRFAISPNDDYKIEDCNPHPVVCHLIPSSASSEIRSFAERFGASGFSLLREGVGANELMSDAIATWMASSEWSDQ